MNVYIVIGAEGPHAFAKERQAVTYAEGCGLTEVHEVPVVGGALEGGVCVRRHGDEPHGPPVLRPESQGVVRGAPGAILGPNGRYVGPDGSELIQQPHLPTPENRRPPTVPAPGPRLRGCSMCGRPLPPQFRGPGGMEDVCPACIGAYQQVQRMPNNPEAPPETGAVEADLARR